MSWDEFQQQLSKGKVGESRIAAWLRRHGRSVLPVYEIIKNEGKGPTLFLPDKVLIAPDRFVFGREKACWIEAKHKSAFTWHRCSQTWVTGIDLRHYGDYCQVDELTPWPVWLLFLHENGTAKDSPEGSPTGLFGETLAYLKQNEHHRHTNWGRTGMVYWEYQKLRLLAKLGEV